MVKLFKALYGPTTQIPDYGIWNSPGPLGLIAQSMGSAGAL